MARAQYWDQRSCNSDPANARIRIRGTEIRARDETEESKSEPVTKSRNRNLRVREVAAFRGARAKW